MNPEWIYCETCDCVAMICPECGNNCCNGMYGRDGKCPVCPEVYRMQHMAYEEGTKPSKEGLRVLPDSMKQLLDELDSK